MLDKIYYYSCFQGDCDKPQSLSKSGKEAALVVLSEYFTDSERDLEALIESIRLVPSEVNGKVVFTKKSLELAEELKKSKNFILLAEMKAEYLHNILNIDEGDAFEYILQIDTLKNEMAKVLPEGHLELNQIRAGLTEYDLEEAKKQEAYYEDRLDKTYYSFSDEENYAQAVGKVKKIEKNLKIAPLLGEFELKSAVKEYQKAHTTEIKTRV